MYVCAGLCDNSGYSVVCLRSEEITLCQANKGETTPPPTPFLCVLNSMKAWLCVNVRICLFFCERVVV